MDSERKERWKRLNDLQVRISAKNQRSLLRLEADTRVDRSGNVEGPDRAFAVTLIEARESSVVLEIPNPFCAQEDIVQISIAVGPPESSSTLEIVSRVSQFNYNMDSASRAYATFLFTNYDVRAWRELCATMERQQAELEELFHSLKD